MTNPLENQLCFLLYVSSKEIIKQYTTYLKPFELTYTGFITMLALEENKHYMVKELGERLFLDSGTLTPLLKKLEEKGYVTRERSMIDERQMNVSLTRKGIEIRKELPCISEKIALEMDISDEQFLLLKDLLLTFVKRQK
jgi:MarR family transcriptional regulator, organic hydroperoxide resistance regulator